MIFHRRNPSYAVFAAYRNKCLLFAGGNDTRLTLAELVSLLFIGVQAQDEQTGEFAAENRQLRALAQQIRPDLVELKKRHVRSEKIADQGAVLSVNTAKLK